MYGLPTQTIEHLTQDLELAVASNATHLSFYNLTIEPNTYFEKYPPEQLPSIDMCYEMQDLIVQYLANHSYNRYEVSAYCKAGFESQHNSNYWLFGDYIGIGAGAASKISNNSSIIRRMNVKHPESYMKSNFNHGMHVLTTDIINSDALIGEFMMNALRLVQGFDEKLFHIRTGIKLDSISAIINEHIALGNLYKQHGKIIPTKRGLDILNNILIDFI
jgi:oxygen-independent coproporphyrinogen-3 oxidase